MWEKNNKSLFRTKIKISTVFFSSQVDNDQGSQLINGQIIESVTPYPPISDANFLTERTICRR